jgi:hypothetical protein
MKQIQYQCLSGMESMLLFQRTMTVNTFATDAHTSKQNQRPFPFLHLPRDIRDEIYLWVLAIPSKTSKLRYDNVRTQAYQAKIPSVSGNIIPTVCLLSTSSIVHEEFIDAIYRNSAFFLSIDAHARRVRNKSRIASMDLQMPIFRIGGACSDTKDHVMQGVETECAVPFGWNLTRIRDMYLRINVGRPKDHAKTFTKFDFSGLADMRALVRLTILIACLPSMYPETDPSMDFLNISTSGNDLAGAGIEEFRAMVKTLRNAVPKSVQKIDFDIDVDNAKETRPEDWKRLRSVWCVPGHLLEVNYRDITQVD